MTVSVGCLLLSRANSREGSGGSVIMVLEVAIGAGGRRETLLQRAVNITHRRGFKGVFPYLFLDLHIRSHCLDAIAALDDIGLQ